MYYFSSQVHVDPFSSMEPNASPPPKPPLFIDPTPTATTVAATTTDHHQWCLSLAIIGKSLTSVLTRFHAGYFRITLSLGSQALLWRSLIEPSSTHNIINNPLIHHIFHRLHPVTYTSLWLLAFIILSLLSFLYLLRLILQPELVKAEFQHSVGVNYLFAPWISWLLLLQCAPILGEEPGTAAYLGLWWALVVPMVALDIKIYGQWFTTKGQRCNLTAVANPSSQMTVIGNLVGSRAAALMGWHETAMVLFSLGMVHYLVLFVTLYQRLSGTNTLPAMLRPVFSLFFAAPAVASLAWAAISGRFDTPAKMLFFLSLFLFTSLVSKTLRLLWFIQRMSMQTESIQEGNEEVQRDMVGIPISNDSGSNSSHRIRRRSAGQRGRCAHAGVIGVVSGGHISLTSIHLLQHKTRHSLSSPPPPPTPTYHRSLSKGAYG
ncbi:hypothetical protein Cgig2_005874 [Carnegiea gigantea]|uniref:Uncharacterized protein n=1 Tax=Carnegiea gigantea TaxID=171969 RepID=A0A9Q1KP46_9CARY|nr:hypothetical protein Cgig2_005874 [Carnegiea gigantea]